MKAQIQIKDPNTFITATTIDGYDSVPSVSITLDLIDKSGIEDWSLECVSADDNLDKNVVNSTDLVVDDLDKSAVLDVSSNYLGSSYIFESIVDGSSYRFAIYSLGVSGERLLSLNELNEGSTFGWITHLNAALESTTSLSALVNPMDDLDVEDLTCKTMTVDGGSTQLLGPVFNIGIEEVEITGTYNSLTSDILLKSSFICSGTGGSRQFVLPTGEPSLSTVPVWTIINDSASPLDVRDGGVSQRVLTTYESCKCYVISSGWIVEEI